MSAEPKDPPSGWVSHLWKRTIQSLVFLFVCWHLFALMIRNPLDMWKDYMVKYAQERPWWDKWKDTFEKVDRADLPVRQPDRL